MTEQAASGPSSCCRFTVNDGILQVVLLYAMLAALWIIFSDYLLGFLVSDPEALVVFSVLKGFLFVAVTALLLYWLLRYRLKAEVAESLPPGRGAGLFAWPRWTFYLLAAVLSVAGLLLRLKIAIVLANRPLLSMLVLPVIVAAALGGFGPGFAATAIITGAVVWSLPPAGHFFIAAVHDLVPLAMFIANGLLISFICEILHRSRYWAVERQCRLDLALQAQKEAGRVLLEAEAALQESREVLRLFVEHAPAALAMFDREMRYLAASRRWVQDYAIGDREIIGRSHYEIFPEISEEIKALHHRGLAGEVVRADQDRFVRQDGREQWLCWEMRPWYTADGAVGGIMIFSEDITRLKSSEEELRRLNLELEERVAARTAALAAVNRELDSFTYSVSHDLKAPLRGIEGYSRLLVEEHAGQLDDEGKQFLANIRQGTRQMGRLIDDLLSYSRMERRPLQAGELDARVLLDVVIAERQEEISARGVELRVSMDECTVRADAEGLAVVLRNLLDNALKFTIADQRPLIEVGCRHEDGRCLLVVQDNGIGFDMKHHERIFEVFQRLQRSEEYPGTGVGLAIVRRAVERMGGRVWAESSPGQGVTFYVELPR